VTAAPDGVTVRVVSPAAGRPHVVVRAPVVEVAPPPAVVALRVGVALPRVGAPCPGRSATGRSSAAVAAG
jgi:hypothetical protein